MKFIFVTTFPSLIQPYFQDSILNRAIKLGLIEIEFFNPRDFSLNKHKKTDDYATSGGAGMVMTMQPLFDTLENIRKIYPASYFIFPLPVGKPFEQKDATRLSKKDVIVFVCGRYEGIDERIIEIFASELFSIGDYVLTGGELASTVMSDAISRCVPSVLGNEDSLNEESFNDFLLEAPMFSKPFLYKNLKAPSTLLKGDHGKISALKKCLALAKTQFYRPDLLAKYITRT